MSRQKAAAVAEQKIRRHLGANDAELAARISAPARKKTVFTNQRVFRITGLKESKAANNDDRGEKGLLDFLERKSGNKGHAIKIIRVSVRSGRETEREKLISGGPRRLR